MPPLHAPGAILLVNVYDLGRRPAAVAGALAALRAAGFDPAARDVSVEPLGDDALRAARLVAISVPMHTALRLGVRLAERVRAVAPGAHVCLFGLYAALNRQHLLGRHCDSVAGGEADAFLCALAARLAGGEAAAESDPAPARREPALPPPERYARLIAGDGETRLVATVEATHGCKHLCRHCPIVPVYRGRFRAVPREEVLAQVAAQISQGARHVTFADPDFLNGPTHALRLARALRERWPGTTFDATVKIEHLLQHRALLPELAECGCLFLTTAVESLSERVLSALRKGHSAADVPRALALARAAGIELRPTLLPYTPWTELGDLPALFDFAESHRLADRIDPVQFTLRLLLPPGSALLEGDEERPWLGEFDATRFTWGWRHPDPRVDALQAASASLAGAHATDGRPAEETFPALRALAEQAAGRPARTASPRVGSLGGYRRDRSGPPLASGAALAADAARRGPRISEPWFC